MLLGVSRLSYIFPQKCLLELTGLVLVSKSFENEWFIWKCFSDMLYTHPFSLLPIVHFLVTSHQSNKYTVELGDVVEIGASHSVLES